MSVLVEAKTASVTTSGSVTTFDVTNLTVVAGNGLLAKFWTDTTATLPAGLTAVWDPGGAAQSVQIITGTDTGTNGALTSASCLFGLLAPVPGNKILRFSWPTTALIAHASAMSLTGVDQTSFATSFRNGTNFNSSSAPSPISLTVTSATGNLVVVSFAQNASVWGAFTGTNDDNDVAGPDKAVAASHASGAASVTLTAAFSGPASQIASGVDILAAGGGSPTLVAPLLARSLRFPLSRRGLVVPAALLSTTVIPGPLVPVLLGNGLRRLPLGKPKVFVPQGSIPFQGPVPTLVQVGAWTVNDNNGITGNAFVFNPPNLTLAGNCLVLKLAYPYSASRTISISDSTGDTWPAAAVTKGTASTGNMNVGVFVLPNASAGLHKLTITFDTAIKPVQITIDEFYNVATSSPVDGTSGANSVSGSSANAGSFTPSTNNDANGGHLIVSYAISNDTVGTLLANQASAISATNGASLLHADNSCTIPSASAYSVQAANAAINPGFAFTQSTGTNFVVAAVALKAASAGTVPAAGIRIVRLLHCTIVNPQTGDNVLLFPCDGNLRVASMASGDDINPVNSFIDSAGKTYTARSAASQSQIFDTVNAAPSNALTLTINLPPTSQQFSVKLWDIIGADPSPFLNKSGVYTAAPGSGAVVNDLPDHTPSGGPGLTIVQTGFGTGPTNGLAAGAPSGAIYDLIYYTGMTDQDRMDNADGAAHLNYTSAAAQTWNFGIDAAANGSTAFATAISYKSAAAGTIAITVDFGGAIEFLTGVRSDGFVLLEFLASVRADRVSQIEAIAAVRRDGAGSPEFVEGLSGNIAGQLELLGSMRGDNLGPLEMASALRSDVIVLIEALAGQRSDVVAASEILAALRTELVGAVEDLAGVRRDVSAPFENLGTIAVSSDGALQLEATAKLNFDQPAGVEFVSGVRRDAAEASESLAGVAGQGTGQAEALAAGRSDTAAQAEFGGAVGVTGNAGAPIETNTAARADAGLAGEAISAVRGPPAFGVENLAGAASQSAAMVEGLPKVQKDVAVNAEVLGGVQFSANAPVPVEFTAGLAVARAAIVELIQLFAGPTANSVNLLGEIADEVELLGTLDAAIDLDGILTT